MMGLIALITQARSPAALRKSTALVIEAIYAREGAPPEIMGFADELASMLPDDLPNSALPKVAAAICQVMREIKDERIRREHGDSDSSGDDFGIDFGDEDDTDENDAQKKKGGRKDKKNKDRLSVRMMIFGGLALLLSLSGIGGGTYYYFFMEHEPTMGERTKILIEQMSQAAEGKGPERHVFGWALTVETRAGLTGVTAVGVPAGACASAAWYFVNRGNVLINDQLPEKIAPSLLKRFCEEKGQRAKLTWVSKARAVAE